MRPLKGMVVGRGTVECENGVTYRNLDIPTGIKHYDPVLVYLDLVGGGVASVTEDIPEETLAEAHCQLQETPELECIAVPDDIVETDGSGLS